LARDNERSWDPRSFRIRTASNMVKKSDRVANFKPAIQLPNEAIKMTDDGFHWGSRVNVLEVQMFLQRVWEVLSPKR
jgi:hypothetical protein